MSIEATRMWWCASAQLWRASACVCGRGAWPVATFGCGWLMRTVTHPERPTPTESDEPSAANDSTYGPYKGRFMAKKGDGGSFRNIKKEG